MNDVSIRTLPRLSAATVEHIGPYMEVGKAFTQLFEWLNARQLAASDVRVFGAFYDDPRQVAPEKLRSRAAAVTNGPFDVEPPVAILGRVRLEADPLHSSIVSPNTRPYH